MGVPLQCSAILVRERVRQTDRQTEPLAILPLLSSCVVPPAPPASLCVSMALCLLQGLLQGCNSMCAGYLFQQDKQYDVTYDTGDKAIQCGRHVDIFKFWLMWKAKVCLLASLLLSVS